MNQNPNPSTETQESFHNFFPTINIKRSRKQKIDIPLPEAREEEEESESFLFCATNLQKTWCVPKPPSDQAALYDNKNYACGRRVDCGVAQKGTPCFDPHNFHPSSFSDSFNIPPDRSRTAHD
ncbi:Glucan endo-1,3-beta-D-glucosidase, partial [Cucurbita argyrosperma subsp. argyrosperma]